MHTETRGSPLRLAIGLAIVTLTACAATSGRASPKLIARESVATPERYFISELDYLAAGRAGVAAFLQTLDEESRRSLLDALSAAEGSIVTVEGVHQNASHEGTRVSMGTGVLLARSDVVLTAGHVIDETTADHRVVLGDSSFFPAAVIGSRFSQPGEPALDWALLRLGDTLPRATEAVVLAAPVEGSLVFVLGSTGFLGLDGRNRVVMRATTGGPAELRRPLRPLAFLARVESVAPLALELVAGALPRHGMSGSPVFDVEGRLVGLLGGFSVSNRAGGGLRFRIHAQSLAEGSLVEALNAQASTGG